MVCLLTNSIDKPTVKVLISNDFLKEKKIVITSVASDVKLQKLINLNENQSRNVDYSIVKKFKKQKENQRTAFYHNFFRDVSTYVVLTLLINTTSWSLCQSKMNLSDEFGKNFYPMEIKIKKPKRKPGCGIFNITKESDSSATDACFFHHHFFTLILEQFDICSSFVSCIVFHHFTHSLAQYTPMKIVDKLNGNIYCSIAILKKQKRIMGITCFHINTSLRDSLVCVASFFFLENQSVFYLLNLFEIWNWNLHCSPPSALTKTRNVNRGKNNRNPIQSIKSKLQN